MLHASKLKLVHPKSKKEFIFFAKTPKEWFNIYSEETKLYEKNHQF